MAVVRGLVLFTLLPLLLFVVFILWYWGDVETPIDCARRNDEDIEEELDEDIGVVELIGLFVFVLFALCKKECPTELTVLTKEPDGAEEWCRDTLDTPTLEERC